MEEHEEHSNETNPRPRLPLTEDGGPEDGGPDGEVLGGLGPETDFIYPSPQKRVYPRLSPDAPNPEPVDEQHPSVPATVNGYGSKILYKGQIIETAP